MWVCAPGVPMAAAGASVCVLLSFSDEKMYTAFGRAVTFSQQLLMIQICWIRKTTLPQVGFLQEKLAPWNATVVDDVPCKRAWELSCLKRFAR